MNEVIRRDIISEIGRAINILKVKEEKDTAQLRELSNHTIHNASVFQDEDSISVAILVYSLSKIIERMKDIDYNFILRLLEKANDALKKYKFNKFRKTIKRLFSFISSMDNKLKLYIGEVILQAQIKKGSKLYAHGISSARAAEMLGISQWELMSYIGKTRLTDVYVGINAKERLEYARSLFK